MTVHSTSGLVGFPRGKEKVFSRWKKFAAMQRGEALHRGELRQGLPTTRYGQGPRTTVSTSILSLGFLRQNTHDNPSQIEKHRLKHTKDPFRARMRIGNRKWTYHFSKGGLGELLLDTRAVCLRVQEECTHGTLRLVGILKSCENKRSAR